jgi:hypothetical protein
MMTPGMAALRASILAACSPGEVDLNGYPALTYAPQQWGDGIRLARNGEPIEKLVEYARIHDLIGTIEEMSLATGASWSEIFDVLRYARAQELV